MGRVDDLRASRHLIDQRAVVIDRDWLDDVPLPIVNIGRKLERAERLDFPTRCRIAGAGQNMTVAVRRRDIHCRIEKRQRQIVVIVMMTPSVMFVVIVMPPMAVIVVVIVIVVV